MGQRLTLNNRLFFSISFQSRARWPFHWPPTRQQQHTHLGAGEIENFFSVHFNSVQLFKFFIGIHFHPLWKGEEDEVELKKIARINWKSWGTKSDFIQRDYRVIVSSSRKHTQTGSTRRSEASIFFHSVCLSVCLRVCVSRVLSLIRYH